jgi:TetR/AcrR family transcriptional repressor of mexJK operon
MRVARSSSGRIAGAPSSIAPEAPGSASAPTGGEREETGRSARKRRAILEAASGLFLAKGYQDTSMDEIAAAASVSKQTVYKNFADKESLFSEIVLGVTENAERFVEVMALTLDGSEDVERDLRELARRYAASVLQPQVLQLRRLLIGESVRFPALGRAYYERAPERVVAALGSTFAALAARGLLRPLEDPRLAAQQFAYLVLSVPLDRAMFCGERSFSKAEAERVAEAGVRVFLAAYGPG